jgi:hypothetical protein
MSANPKKRLAIESGIHTPKAVREGISFLAGFSFPASYSSVSPFLIE